MLFMIDLSELKNAIIHNPAGEFYLIIYNPTTHLKFESVHVCSSLAPTSQMMRDVRLGILDDVGFEKRYFNYLKHNKIAIELINYLIRESKTTNIYLAFPDGAEIQKKVLLSIFNFVEKAAPPKAG